MKDHEVTNQKAPDEREIFEAWVRASGRSHMLERDSEHGWYENLTITAWWTAWQARAALAATPAKDEPVAMTYHEATIKEVMLLVRLYGDKNYLQGGADARDLEITSNKLDSEVRARFSAIENKLRALLPHVPDPASAIQ